MLIESLSFAKWNGRKIKNGTANSNAEAVAECILQEIEMLRNVNVEFAMCSTFTSRSLHSFRV